VQRRNVLSRRASLSPCKAVTANKVPLLELRQKILARVKKHMQSRIPVEDARRLVSNFLRPADKWSLAQSSRANDKPLESACGLLLCVEPPGRVGVCFYTSVKEEAAAFPSGLNQTLFEEPSGSRTLGVRCGSYAKPVSCKPEIGKVARAITPVKMIKSMIRLLVRAAREYNVGLNYNDRTVAWACGEVPSNDEWTSAGSAAKYPIAPALKAKGVTGLILEDVEAGRETFTFTVFTTTDWLTLRWDKNTRTQRRLWIPSRNSPTTFCARIPISGHEARCSVDDFAEILQSIIDLDAPLRGAIMQSGEEEYAHGSEQERSVRRRLEHGAYVHAPPPVYNRDVGESHSAMEANFYPATFSFSVAPNYDVKMVGSCASQKRKLK